MPKIFSCDVLVCMTAYVIADSEAEARLEIEAMRGETLEFKQDEIPDREGSICGLDFASMVEPGDEVATFTLSPAVTLYGPIDGLTSAAIGEFTSDVPVELVHDSEEG